MLEILTILIFLTVVLGLLSEKIQAVLSKSFFDYPNRIFLVPFGLTLFVCSVSIFLEKFNWSWLVIALVYTFVPTAMVYKIGHGWGAGNYSKHKTWLDFLVILLLWLAVEYADFTGGLKIYLGYLSHIVSWGTAVVLGLFLFLGFRSMPGMKYNLPKSWTDLSSYLIGFAASFLILVPMGLLLSFIRPFHIPADLTILGVSKLFTGILFGVAIPEELLFRSLILVCLANKFGYSKKVLFLAALIFGLSHLDNYVKLRDGAILFSPPNWRYAIIATVAGIIYGKVFQKATSIMPSAWLHASVNTVKHSFLS